MPANGTFPHYMYLPGDWSSQFGRAVFQGGLVAIAKVTLLNEGTRESRATVTNGDGLYEFRSVDPATYTVIVESPGFKAPFRFEVFNLTNTLLFNGLNTTATSSSFGQITNQAHYPRIGQIGLRFSY